MRQDKVRHIILVKQRISFFLYLDFPGAGISGIFEDDALSFPIKHGDTVEFSKESMQNKPESILPDLAGDLLCIMVGH